MFGMFRDPPAISGSGLTPSRGPHSREPDGSAVEVRTLPILPGLLAPCSLAGEDPGSAARAVAHAVRNVLLRAGHRKAAGAAELGEVNRAVRLQILLRIRELATGLEAVAVKRICIWFCGIVV